MTRERVTIHYSRPPDRLQIFEQAVLERSPGCVVTFLGAAELRAPVRAGGRAVLEPGAPVIWFTYPGVWHDIGRFHLRDGTFTGYYANILTPVVEPETGVWHTTDLFLDVWLGADGQVELLDADEFEEAVRQGWISEDTAARAQQEADGLMDRAREERWPPPEVRSWTLDRARRTAAARDE